MGYFDSIYSDDNLPHRAKAVYMYLRDRMDSQRQCWPGIRRIASDLRLSRSTVKRALNELERSDYLRRERRNRDHWCITAHRLSLKIAHCANGPTPPPGGGVALLLDRGVVHGGPPGREHFKDR